MGELATNKGPLRIPITEQLLRTNSGPFISKPQTISEYCVTYDREVVLGRGAAKNLYDKYLRSRPNSFSLDLNNGFETFDEKTGDEELNILLKWIELMGSKGGKLKKITHDADVVCWRGLLTKIATTGVNKRESWKFLAVKKKGVVFMMENETIQKIRREQQKTDRDARMCYWGFKFEQYMTFDDQQTEPDTSIPVTTKEEFAGVFRTNLESVESILPNRKHIKLLYSGEIDCLNKEGDAVELKTNRGELEKGFYMGGKSAKWWMQSFLAAIDSIVVGHRDDNGYIKKVSTIRVNDIARFGGWNGNACLHILSLILSHVLSFLHNDNDACVVEYDGDKGLNNGIVVTTIPSSNCSFVNEEFLNKFN